MLPVTFPPIVLSSEQLEGGLSVPDSCEEEDDDEETDPVFCGRIFPSPGSAVFAVEKELCSVTFPLDSAIPSEDIAVPLMLAVPFMML